MLRNNPLLPYFLRGSTQLTEYNDQLKFTVKHKTDCLLKTTERNLLRLRKSGLDFVQLRFIIKSHEVHILPGSILDE